jgi:hypothetical protein
VVSAGMVSNAVGRDVLLRPPSRDDPAVTFDVSAIVPSAWMWFHPWDVRLHECFSRWLRRNYAVMDQPERWGLYECPHPRMW